MGKAIITEGTQIKYIGYNKTMQNVNLIESYSRQISELILLEEQTRQLIYTMPNFNIDDNWLDPKQLENDKKYALFLQVLRSARLPRDISKFDKFVQWLSNFKSKIGKIGKNLTIQTMISRLAVLQIFDNLLHSKSGSNAGNTFERFVANLFNGNVVNATDNIVDIQFPNNDKFSLKFIKGQTITGSLKGFGEEETVKGRHNIITYLIGIKDTEGDRAEIRFYSFQTSLRKIENFLLRRHTKRQEKQEKQGEQRELTRNDIPDKFSINLGVFKSNKDLSYNFRELGTIDTSGVKESAQLVLEKIKETFLGLAEELETLIDNYNELMYGFKAEEEKQKDEKRISPQAEKVKKVAQEVEKKETK